MITISKQPHNPADHYIHIGSAHNEKQTEQIANALASTAYVGDVLLLSGDLGAGKTTLVQYMALALGIDRNDVRSPTFTLVHEHMEGKLPLIHMDVYRLTDPDEFIAFGGSEYIEENEGLVVIEWGDIVQHVVPDDWLHVQIRFESAVRTFWAHGQGEQGTAWLQRVQRYVQEDDTQ